MTDIEQKYRGRRLFKAASNRYGEVVGLNLDEGTVMVLWDYEETPIPMRPEDADPYLLPRQI